LASLIVCTALPAFAHAEFSSGQLSAIAEHVYRGSTKIRSCETTCSNLWSAEQKGESRELSLELLNLRQEIGLLPTISALGARVTLTGSPRTVYWGVPGERPKIIRITVPAESLASFWCKEGCGQRLQGMAKGVSPGYFTSPLPEDSLVWEWEGPPGIVAGRLQPIEGFCEGHPAIPSGMRIMWGAQSTWCKSGAIEEVGYLPQPDFITSTPIRDETKELPYTFQTSGGKSEPSLEVLKAELASDLIPSKYPYLVQWYHFQFEEGCNPESCEVPNCKALSLEACEALLGEAGFANLEHSTETEANTDFYVPPEGVTRTIPAAGSEAAVNSSVHVYVNPVEETWNEILLRRYRPELVYAPGEAFHADSYKEFTDWTRNSLTRENGEPVENLPYFHTLQEYLGTEYPDEVLATSSDRLVSGGTGNESENSVEQAADVALALRTAEPSVYADKDYARVVADAGSEQTWLQYWFFYYHNPSPPGALGFGEHQGDWEMAQFAVGGLPSTGLTGEHASPLGPGPDPEYIAAAEHTYGRTCPWENVMLNENDVPLLYPAVDSHATYFGPYEGEKGVDDSVSGEGEPVRPEAIPFSETEGWVQWPGFWGGTEPKHPLEVEDSSPHGPADVSQHEQWSDPTAWASGLEEGGGCS
jgi:hypothetical protein